MELQEQLRFLSTNQVGVHGGTHMDDFKVTCIFDKLEFVRNVLNMCTIWLCYDLSCIRG